MGPPAYSPYPRRLESLTICSILDSLTLDPRLLILASRNSNVSTFATRKLSFEDRVETVNLPLSGTVITNADFLLSYFKTLSVGWPESNSHLDPHDNPMLNQLRCQCTV